MPYRIAGIDVHKKMLAVVVADVEIDGDFHFDRHVRYEERGLAVSAAATRIRARKMIRELRSLGYRIELLPAPPSSPA